jgi:DNA repair protein RecN (Recombination protein N)
MILKSVDIRNFLVIENVKVEFESGLNIISGESGSGKSTIIDAICWCLGLENKRTKEVNDGHVILEFDNCKVVSRKGKNAFTLNGKKITKKDLLKLEFLTICRQDHRLSFSTENDFRDVVDNLLNDKNDLDKLKAAYSNYKAVKDEIDQLKNICVEDIDYIKGIVFEIESLNLRGNDEEKLVLQRREEIEIYKAYDSLVKARAVFKNDSGSGVLSQISMIYKYLNSSSPTITELQERVEYITNELIDIESAITTIVSSLNSNEARLEMIDKRLGQIRATAKKYNITSNELLSLLQVSREKINFIENINIHKEKLANDLAFAEKELSAISDGVNQLRKNICISLNSKIQVILDELGMKNIDATLKLNCTTWNQTGDVKINIDLGKRSLSGGEISRLLLAIKLVTSTLDAPVVFDEIDIGVGGSTAYKIGRKLRQLGEIGQVIVVTHQAQVAAHSSHHILVIRDKSVKTEKLSTQTRMDEIARMISGNQTTAESLLAARKLIEECQ